MSTERDFDRIARAWLDLMPSEAPGRALDAVLDSVRTMPQERRRFGRAAWSPRRRSWLTLVAAVAVLGLVTVGGALVGSGSAPSIVTPSVPSSDPSPYVETPPPPDPALLGDWTASWRSGLQVEKFVDVPPRFDITASMHLGPTELRVVADIEGSELVLTARPEYGGRGQVRFVTTADPVTVVIHGVDLTGCPKGSVGLYRWSRPDGSSQLSLMRVHEPCELRSFLLSWDWAAP